MVPVICCALAGCSIVPNILQCCRTWAKVCLVSCSPLVCFLRNDPCLNPKPDLAKVCTITDIVVQTHFS